MKNRRKRKVHRGRRKPNRFLTWFKNLSKKKKIGLCAGLVVLLLLIVGCIFVASKLGKVQKVKIDTKELEIDNTVEESIGTGYTNIALFAGDSRTGNLGKGVRTDGIIIASLNNETGEIKMVSLFRDTLLNIGDDIYTKCNAAYSYGGPKQAVAMLNKNLDLNIKQFVTVDFKAVSEVIDMLDGIEVDVSEAEVYATNKYINETARVAGKKAKRLTHAGLQTLDGVQATTYGRIRKGVGDDYARAGRQRKVIKITIEKALKADILTLNKIVDRVLPMVYTNMSNDEILSYATGLTRYKLAEEDEDKPNGFPFDRTSATLAGKGSCVIPVTLADNVSQLHERLFGKADYQPTSKVLEISKQIEYIVGARTPDANVPYDPDAYTVPKDDKKDDDKTNKTDGDKETHTHTWSAGWQSNGSQHWHVCEGCGKKSDVGNHTKVTQADGSVICGTCQKVLQAAPTTPSTPTTPPEGGDTEPDDGTTTPGDGGDSGTEGGDTSTPTTPTTPPESGNTDGGGTGGNGAGGTGGAGTGGGTTGGTTTP